MQSKNSKIQTKPIEDLIGRIRALKQQNAPDLRINRREAEQLADSLTQVLARLVNIQDEIIDALKTARQAQTVDIEMDGGEFNNK
mgnify:CR=1|jgi:hypothetical protein